MEKVNDENVEALTSIGLTVLQAKTYLALLKSGSSTIKEAAKTARVARQDLYRIMSELQKIGLIEKVISAPTRFKAIELAEGVAILLQHARAKENEARRKILKLMQRYKDVSAKTQVQEEDSHFILVPEKVVIQKIRRAIENTETSLDVITTLSRFRSGIFDFEVADKKASERGVMRRIIINKPEDEKSLTEILKVSTENPVYEVRFINTRPLAVMAIYDKKKMIFALSATAAIHEVPILMSNNPSLLAVVQSYFEAVWSTALEFEP